MSGFPNATNDAGEGIVCVGTPTDDDELRCVFAGAGVTSLDPDEFNSVIELFTRMAAAVMRPTREGVLIDTERVLLPLLFTGCDCAMTRRVSGKVPGHTTPQ